MSSTVIEQITSSVPAAAELAVTPTTPAERGPARLVVTRGPWRGTGVALSVPVITIGRHRANHIALGDSTVSAQHAEIRMAGGRYLIADVGSFTGTYVNRQPVDEAELRDGDEIWIGRHRLLFQHPASAPES